MTLVTYIDLVNYLICSKSLNTHEDLKAYKGLDAYTRFIDGEIGSLCAISLLNRNLAVDESKGLLPTLLLGETGPILNSLGFTRISSDPLRQKSFFFG